MIRKKLIIIGLVSLIMTLLSGCLMYSREKDDEQPKIISKGEDKGIEEKLTPTEAPEIEKFAIGDVVDYKGINIVLESVEKSYGDKDEDFSMFAPEEGKVFIVCNFLVENNTDSDLNISYLYFQAYEDGYTTDAYIFTDGVGVEDLSGTASPGKKIKGALVYEVSEDFSELELEYEPSLWSNKKVTFLVTNK